MSSAVVWFRRDLRLEDNPAWAEATSAHDEVTALYVLDDRLGRAAGPHRRAFLHGCLVELDRRLRDRGGRLHVRRGDPVSLVPGIVAGCDGLYVNADTTPYSARRDAAVEAAVDLPVHRSWGTLVHAPGTVVTASGSLSRVFTPFWKAWSRLPVEPVPGPGPATVVDDPGDGLAPAEAGCRPAVTDDDLRPGERAALARLERFVARVPRYASQRDRPAVEGTSHLSADLRFGTVSPRRVLAAVSGHDDGSFARQLAWRDWYAHLLAEEPALATRPLRRQYEHVAWIDDPDDLAAWQEGRTGFPVVDAGMRELLATGWMHNRVRMIAASFLVKDLLVRWQAGERWFRHHLIDFDVAQNAGNWQWVAGTGPDAAPYFRVLNPVTQSRRFDPEGRYIRRWVPELRGLDDSAVHAPWEADPLELAAAGIELGRDYPTPIVEHAQARQRCLAAYAPARRGR